MKVEGERVTEIDREQETVSASSTAKYIGQCACFNGLLSLLDLERSNIIIIEEYAFAHCYQLRIVLFPSCLQEICEGSFYKCINLRLIILGSESKITVIKSSAFRDCENLNEFDFPPLFEVIEDNAFECLN